MSTQRIIEAIVIALLSTSLTVYTMTVRLDERDKHQSKSIDSLVIKMDRLTQELNIAQLKMTDRWTATQQAQHEIEVSRKFDTHELRGHWNERNPD